MDPSTLRMSETFLPPRDGQLDKNLYKITDSIRRGEAHISTILIDGEEVVLPSEVLGALVCITEAMQQGKAISVVPHDLMVSTQDAADTLGISRPALIHLLDKEKIPYQRVKTHRRLYLSDVIRYRDSQRRISDDALTNMVADAQIYEDYEQDPQAVKEALDLARKKMYN